MNSRRSVTCMLPVVVLLLAFSLAIGAQGPLLPTLARLDALKLASIEGDVPVRYRKGASRDVASALAGRIAECRGLLSALGEHGVDRYVHLAALHEVGHLLTDAALETTTEAIPHALPVLVWRIPRQLFCGRVPRTAG